MFHKTPIAPGIRGTFPIGAVEPDVEVPGSYYQLIKDHVIRVLPLFPNPTFCLQLHGESDSDPAACTTSTLAMLEGVPWRGSMSLAANLVPLTGTRSR